MKINRINLIKLGIFVVTGLVIFLLAIYYLGKQQNLFRSGIAVYTDFKDVKGLQNGNTVRYLGTYAGYVSSIRLVSDTVVRTEMVIDHAMSRFIRENSQVEIQNDGVMGSKVVVIHPGTPDYHMIRAGSRLPAMSSMSIEEIFRALEGTVDYTTRAAQNLWKVSESVVRGDGILGQLLYDESMRGTFDQFLANLNSITRETQQVIQKANSPESDLGRLLNDDQINQRITRSFNGVDSLLNVLILSTQQIRQATEAINESPGLINKLLYDRNFANEVDTSVVRLNDAIEDVMQTSETLRRSWIFNLFPGRRRDGS